MRLHHHPKTTKRSRVKPMVHSDKTRMTATYTAFLVRLWQENEEMPWRASVQSARTGEKTYFSDLESLFVYLRAQTTTCPANETTFINCADASQR
jgi:hypothetical protein